VKCALCDYRETPANRSVCYECVPMGDSLFGAEVAIELKRAKETVAACLDVMDDHHKRHGDHGTLRKCRDRLRALLPPSPNHSPADRTV
jgi:hypothetical protein